MAAHLRERWDYRQLSGRHLFSAGVKVESRQVDMNLGAKQHIEKLLQSADAHGRIPVIVLAGATAEQAFERVFSQLNAADLAKLVVFAVDLPPCDGLSSLRAYAVATDELNQGQGCLCCSIRSELASSLSQLFLRVLRRQEPTVALVVIVTEARDASGLTQALKHAPFLGQRYRLVACLPLTGA